MFAVDQRWGQALNMPKMRHFKQILPYLRLYNIIRFIDGKFVELLHDIGKTLQREHSNHHTTHKEQVSNQSFRMLTMLYVLNGGSWGLDMSHRLGPRCLNLRDPKNLTRVNPAIASFQIDPNFPQQHKFQITGLYSQTAIPTAISQIQQHHYIASLMSLVNNGLDTISYKISFQHLINKHNKFTIRKIKQFRFHDHHSSFVINFANKHKCLMKNNNNQICEFSNTYKISYPGNQDILVAFGAAWPIYRSNTTSQWIDNKYNSMDFIDFQQRRLQWFYLTNMQEPVILIHECVPFDEIQSRLPPDWRNITPTQFYKDFAFNMHKLREDINDIKQQHPRRDIQCPCGPVFKCKRHKRNKCRNCTTTHEVYSRKKWKVEWICNTIANNQYRILDSKNGLNMSLMQTVQYEHK